MDDEERKPTIPVRILLVCLGTCAGAIWGFLMRFFILFMNLDGTSQLLLFGLPVLGAGICGYVYSKASTKGCLIVAFFIAIIAISIGIKIIYAFMDW